MHRIIITMVFILPVMFMASCGTIIHGTTQQIGISSNPSNGSVTINGQQFGNTPMIIHLSRKDSHMIRIELDGYHAYETTLTRSTSGWVWGNIVFGGLIGLVIDASSGGMYILTPDQVTAEMRARSSFTSPDSDDLYMAVVLEADPSWEKIDILALK
jgi:hypothetical protein